VEYISDRVAVMYLGEIIETADSRELYRHPLHPYSHALLSSIPRLEPTKKRRRIILPGDVPSPINPPAGCRFHPRCPLAFEPCSTTVPKELELGSHKVRCHAVEQQLVQLGPDAAAISQLIGREIATKTGASTASSPAGTKTV
jgi:oligopeptide/dipeptide ABC transporter ATP-binding protein